LTRNKKRILLGASYSNIEPLGLLHLGGLARDLGWDREYCLVEDHNYAPLLDLVRSYGPEVVGFNVYTGNHLPLWSALQRLRMDHPSITVVLGGPHATYFPVESSHWSDATVMSEGFGALEQILTNDARGIMPMGRTHPFPMPDRERFYEGSPRHAQSKIKSVITMTGCPYTCTYCYNSSSTDDLDVPPELAAEIAARLGKSGRLFPKNVRPVDDVVAEGREIAEKWPTEVIYFQDDVHGFDIKGWMVDFAQKWPVEVGIPYHAQMRWEMTHGTSGSERLDLLKDAGCFGMTLAIEAADPVIRDEVLSRKMDDSLVFDGMRKLVDRGFKVRTEQITGLPYGATTKPTPINLDADLGLVELNVRLKEETGGPTMAWASTLAPYKGTKLGAYCEQHGHYVGDNNDVKDTFFERSVLSFPSRWVGPILGVASPPEVWLVGDALETYRDQNAELRRHFNLLCEVPRGHELARRYIEKGSYSYQSLCREITDHCRELASGHDMGIWKGCLSPAAHPDIKELVPYFACLPKPAEAMKKTVEYAEKNGRARIDPDVLSTAIRHHLYDNVLYFID
jgi:radical SAM superfamily enzyme YgiQ (UPF0313 family)